MNNELSIQEACERLNIAASTVLVLCQKGVLAGAYQDANKQWRIPAAAVATYPHQQQSALRRHVPWWRRLRAFMTRKRVLAVLVALGSAVLMIIRLLEGSGFFGR